MGQSLLKAAAENHPQGRAQAGLFSQERGRGFGIECHQRVWIIGSPLLEFKHNLVSLRNQQK
jgi:hypothetical protein